MSRGRGLRCPKCGEVLTRKLVAYSRAQPGGHMRTRYCCGQEVTTFERVVDSPPIDGMIISGISGHDKGVLRRVVEAMGGTLWR
jgi:hypothetical protein